LSFKEILYEIGEGESKTLEFKEIMPSGDKIAKTAIAFSNKAGGKILIGISDSGEIIGTDVNNISKIKDSITSTIWDMCQPHVNFEVFTDNIMRKHIIVIRVFPGNLKPYYLKHKGKESGTYIRVGATNRKAENQNILELERERENISFDEEIDYSLKPGQIDISFIIDKFKKIGKNINEEKLINLGLLKQKNSTKHTTKALAVLSGVYDSTVTKCARFKGLNKTTFIDKKEYRGNLFSQIDSIEQFLHNHLHTTAIFEGFQRKDALEIPLLALREAITNAIVHRDYSNPGRDIKIAIYDNRLEIVSPGSLPNTLTIHEIFEGRSEIRNRLIAKIFKETGYIEQWGSGIERMVNLCIESNLPKPLLKETGDSVSVTFFRKNSNIYEATLDKTVTLIKQKRPQTTTNDHKRPQTTTNDRKQPQKIEHTHDTTKEELKILNYIQQHRQISMKEAISLLPFGKTKIKELFNTLIKKEYIERKGYGKGTFYVLLNNSVELL